MSPNSDAMQTLLQNWATYSKDVSAVILHLDPVCFLELQPAAGCRRRLDMMKLT